MQKSFIEEISEWFKTETDVPQMCALDPLLFAIVFSGLDGLHVRRLLFTYRQVPFPKHALYEIY